MKKMTIHCKDLAKARKCFTQTTKYLELVKSRWSFTRSDLLLIKVPKTRKLSKWSSFL